MKKILFVCTGNTCRSPMAECILRQKARQAGLKIRVSSAGLAADPNCSVSPNAAAALKTLGYPVPRHKARQLTPEMLTKFNLTLTMTAAHKSALGGGKNLMTLGEFTGLGDVPDPYGGDLAVYLATARMLEQACDVIVEMFG